jgi:hypothetical protein
MRVVFTPSNRRIVQLIEEHSHLLEDDDMPQVLLDFCAHVAGYEVTITDWDRGDYSVLVSIIDHPGSVLPRYAASRFTDLKTRQRQLPRATSRGRPRLLSRR